MRSQPVDPQRRVLEASRPSDVSEPSIIELPGSGPLRREGGTDRWLGAVIALCSAVVCLGFLGHAATASPPPVTPIHSPTAQPTGRAATETSPPPTTTAILTSSVTGVDAEDLLGALSPVSIWHVEPIATGSGPVVFTVDGYAPSTIDSVSVAIQTRSGSLLRSLVAPLAVDEERSGSDGGRRLGLGTFHLRIVLARSNLIGGFRVETTWQDPATGSQGFVSQFVPGVGGG